MVVCWTERPDSAPEWYQAQVANAGTQRKRTESSVTAGIAYSFEAGMA